MSWLTWPYAYPRKPAVGKARIFFVRDLATGATPDSLTLPISLASRITRIELDASAVTEFFKYADAYVQSPAGEEGSTIRLASGQLLPQRDARLVQHCDVAVKDNSEIRAAFYGITSGTQLWCVVTVVEE